MQVIPAIDLLQGKCVRLNQGDFEKVTEFSNNPGDQALSWEREGAKRIHVVDLDGAKTGEPINDKSIKEILSKVNIPIQIGGGIRSIERVERLLDYGVDKVILGTIAIENKELVQKLATRFPGKIIVGIDSKKGKVATRGWLKQSNIVAVELTKELCKIGISAIISTDIETDGTLNGPNLNAMRDITIESSVPVIASGGVGSIGDLLSLLSLESYGLEGVIVGRALYDKKFGLKEAIQAIGDLRIQDIPKHKEFLA